MKRWLIVIVLTVISSAAGWVAFAWTERSWPPTGQSGKASAAASAEGLIVHEWGTFTSFTGSDGVRLEFRPLLDSDLPPFVMDRSQHGGDIFAKRNYRALVRMETPVTYFYTDHPLRIRARVGFPEGLLTEFYPPVAKIMPEYDRRQEPVKNSSLDWGEVQLIPTSYLGKEACGELAAPIKGRSAQELLPQSQPWGAAGEHYSYARETDAALVHVHRERNPEHPFAPTGDFFEKFLFYRGLGNFALPVKVEGRGQGRFRVSNIGSDDVSWFMVLEVSAASVRFGAFNGVSAGQERAVSLGAASPGSAALEDELRLALVAEGLYEKEAQSMIKTWRSSWFTEPGTRVLYMVPPRLIEDMLPLHIEPQPEKTVRVLVGRLDLMTPEAEAAALGMVQRSAVARAVAARLAHELETELVYPLPEEIKQLGRFAEPALARIFAVSDDPRVQQEAARLIKQVSEAKAVAGIGPIVVER